MVLPGTKMHVVTLCIAAFEILMLVIQVIYLLERPSDKRRLWYFFLLVLLILYNVCSGIFPDPQVPIPLQMQTIIAYLVGFTMSMYVVYYFYKVFELTHLRFFVTYGLLLFLLAPFLFLFVVPFLLTGDIRLSSRLTVVIPFFYGLSFIYCASRALLKKFRKAKHHGNVLRDPLYEHAVVAYISMLCWAALPAIVFIGDYQILEHSVTNAGFMLMTVIYIRSAITHSRQEYEALQKSQRHLKELNNNLLEKVKERTKSLEEVHEQQTNTFINLAHETKTPLTLINNYLQEYINRKGDSDELKIVKANLQRLTTDMVNFFDLERIKKGFNIYDHSKISDFSELLLAKLELFKAIALKKEIVITATIAKSVMAKANPAAIDRIINNLLENAIRYTPQGGTIVVTLAPEDRHLCFSVSDSGNGIPEKFHNAVFEPYFQLSGKGKATEGMGVGLSIVKKVVDDLGGTITLLSQEGTGTTLVVSLKIADSPIAKAEGTLTSAEIVVADFPRDIRDQFLDDSRPLILVVEDNKTMLAYLVNKLSNRYNVLVATSGAEALQKLKTIKRLDLILSDIMMNPLNGMDFCKILSSHSKLSHIPLIFLSAKATLKDKADGFRAGAVDFIEKPFRIEFVISRIEALLSFAQRQRSAIVRKELTAISHDEPMAHPDDLSFDVNCRTYRLSAREVEIVSLVKKGYPYKKIAEELFISIKTVNAHMKNIFEKCAVKTKGELVSKLSSRSI